MKLRLPHDEQAERAVLAAILLDPECWAVASDSVRASDFYEPKHAEIWRACKALMDSGSAIDLVLLRSQLSAAGKLEAAGGDEYLMTLADAIPTVENTARVASRVRELAILREVVRASLQVADEGCQPISDVRAFLDRSVNMISRAVERRTTGLQVTTLADALDEAYTVLAQRQQSGQSLLGYSTGFVDLDRALSGFAPGDLIVLAARPGMGKTALANSLKLGVARATGKHVICLELEMSREQLAHRLLSSESYVDLKRIRSARLNQEDMRALAATADELSRLPIVFIERRDTRMSDLRAAARKYARENGELGLVVVDYLQIAKPESRTNHREREVAEISASLKALAGELRCPVLALSQLNRAVESRSGSDRRPRLSDLRESGAIEQDADTVLLLHREEVYDPNTEHAGIAEVIVAKQRSGSIGTVRLRWVAGNTRFDNLARFEQPAQDDFDQSSHGHTRSNGHYEQGRQRV